MWRAGILTVLLISVVVYLPSLSGEPVWDDPTILSGSANGGGNSLIHCFTRPFLGKYYRPMVPVSFYLERPFFHGAPFYCHLTNIIIHALTALVIIFLLSFLYRSKRIAIAGGLLFALQPVQVSAVAWIGGRTESLCTLFMSIFCYGLMRAVRLDGKTMWKWMALSLIAWTFAVFTKEQALPSILLVPLAYRLFKPYSDSHPRWRVWMAIAPFIYIATLYMGLMIAYGPSHGQFRIYNPADIPFTFLHTILYYAGVLIIPSYSWIHSLSLGYLSNHGIWSLAGGGCILAMVAGIFSKWRTSQPEAAWFLAYIVLNLAMVSNIILLQGTPVTPSRAGIAGVGVAALLGWMLGSRHLGHRPFALRKPLVSQELWRMQFRRIILACFLCWCCYISFNAAREWQNEVTAASVIIKNDPDCVWARYKLSCTLLSRHNTRPAIEELSQLLNKIYRSDQWSNKPFAIWTLRSDPRVQASIRQVEGTGSSPRKWLSCIYASMGFALLDEHRNGEAEGIFHIGELMSQFNPDNYLGLGYCMLAKSKYAEAVRYLSLAVAINPDLAKGHAKLAQAYIGLKQRNRAKVEFEVCLEKQPLVGKAPLERSVIQSEMGDHAGALASLTEAGAISRDRTDITLMLSR